MDRCVRYEIGVDSDNRLYRFDVESPDCLETVWRLLRDFFETVSKCC